MEKRIFRLIKPADVVTLINALLGFAAIIMLFHAQMDEAIVLILFAVIADAADGAIARYNGFGVLGENLDSLADVISFGVAPAFAVYIFLGGQSYYAAFFASVFLVCGVLRLARFNVGGNKEGFTGLPITAGGFIVVLLLLIQDYFADFELLFIVSLVVVSLLMVSTINYPKLKNPYLLAPMGFLLLLDIVSFFLGYTGILRIASLLLLLLVMAYILTPVWRKLNDRRQ